MINLPLNLGKIASYNGTPTPLFEDYEFQEKLQFNLLVTAVLCVPIMLLVKPMFFLAKSYGKGGHHEPVSSIDDDHEAPLLPQVIYREVLNFLMLIWSPLSSNLVDMLKTISVRSSFTKSLKLSSSFLVN